ncbi:ABC transporter ATP-binding protein [Amphibacillus xylanus]|uniref:Putative ABC transporter ATP-binding protein n=1 Tax=Amphibacillus xylanus (strain ATCC 51415 / DSM 6626 / JCM 7361 / LMG 17667 / NBRC 15112 / Ep01) TaxID=698758 RepID=K0IX83_AMPXN|nr:ABC transporter ATP-binding protein [Amphibacillus xylanus]BAM46999.1 putative ABC transporter ATP-binding protein [Amphibacillus xylanus NBRC 15112]
MRIEIDKITKTFGKETALKQLSLELSGNKIIGLLGKNGAGKTTLLRLLAGHFRPSSGEIKINQQPSFDNYNVTKDICFIEENHNFYPKFRVDDILKLSAVFYPNWNTEEANQLLNIFKLKKKQKIHALSKGMLSALGIIVGISSHAPLTIFDEPYIGLDATARSTFYELLLSSYQEDPRMIVLSTHLIDEVSNLFEEVVILHDGEVLLQELADDLATKHQLISGSKQAVDRAITGKNVIYQSELLGRKSAIIFDDQIDITSDLTSSHVSLQELFVYLTKEEVAQNVQSN